jgi:hypothetical protein
VVRDGLVGCNNALVEQARGRGSPQSLHVLDKPGELGQLLRDLRLGCLLSARMLTKAER